MVLFGSISYMNVTYNIDNITILFVKHLAIADLLSLIFVVLPLAVLHAARRWVLGCVTCYILGVVNNYPGLLHIHFILLISVHRLVRCVAPVKSGAVFKKNMAYLIVGLIWAYCAILPLFIMMSQLEIRLITDSCTLDTYDYGSSQIAGIETGTVMTVFWVVGICIPFVLVILCIVLLAITSLKLSGVMWNKNKKILITTLMIGGSFIVSWSPHIVFTIWRAFDASLSSSSLNRLPQYCHMISLCVNPIIYTIVNRNFKKFMKEHARKVSEATTSFSTGTSTYKADNLNNRVRRWTNFEIIFENSPSNKPHGSEPRPGQSRRFSYAPGVFKEASGRRSGRRMNSSHPELSHVSFNLCNST